MLKFIPMKNCLACSLKNNYPICLTCLDNPFKIERCRQILASKKDFKVLKTLYKPSLKEIIDSNKPSFWDDRFQEIQLLNEQDGMTQDRIKIASSFLPKTKLRILNIGTGPGFLEEILSELRNIELFGCDISKRSIDNLNKRFRGGFSKQSVYKLKYSMSSFDAVFALELLEHILPNKILDVLTKINKLLKKKSLFIVSVPINEGLEKMDDNPSAHVRDYSKDLIIAELMMANYEILEIKELFAFHNLYSIKKSLSHVLKRWKSNNIVIKAQKP